MGHEWSFIRAFDLTSGSLGNIACCVELHAFLSHRFLHCVHDGYGGQVLVWTDVPRNIKDATALHGTPYGVGHDRDRGISNLANEIDARHLLRFLVIEAFNRSANDRAACQESVLHAWQSEIDTKVRRSSSFRRGIEAVR